MTTLQKISRNALLLISGNAVSQAIFFYGIVLAAALLPAEDFGRFSVAQALSVFCIRLAEVGLETYSVRRLVLEQDDSRVVREYGAARAAGTVLVLMVIAGAVLTAGISEHSTVVMFVCAGAVISNAAMYEWFFQGRERMGVIAVGRVVRSLVFVLPLIVLPSADLWTVSVAFVASYLVPTILLNGIMGNGVSLFRWNVPLGRVRTVLWESLPLGVNSVLMQIPFNAGTILVGAFAGLDAAGVYSAGYRIALVVWSYGVISISNAMYPTLTGLSARTEDLSAFVIKATIVLTFMAGSLVAGSFIGADGIVLLLYSGKYEGAGFILLLSLIAVSFVIARTALEYSLPAMDRLSPYVTGMAIVSGLYIILGSAAVMAAGAIGMVYAAVIAEVLYTTYLLLRTPLEAVRRPVAMIWGRMVLVCILTGTVDAATEGIPFWIGSLTTMTVFLLAGALFFRTELRELRAGLGRSAASS